MPVNTTVATTAMQLYVIDGALPEIDTLIQSIGPDRAIFILDPTKDGILQLAERLSQESGLDAIHILSHGSPGSLLLGSSLRTYSSLLLLIANSRALDVLDRIQAARCW